MLAADAATLQSLTPQVIGIGGLAVTADPRTSFTTVLGSCISVGIWDPANHVGGINHFLLATVQGEASGDLRYGEVTLPALINRMLTLGADPSRLKAIVVGGASVIRSRIAIGTENADFAIMWLDNYGVDVMRKDTGGTHARRFTFAPGRSSFKISTIADPPHPFD
ncbi:MAG: chemotaxis protein CheD [Pseudomonadota bacterium]